MAAESKEGYPPQLSFWEKADLLPAYLSIIGTALYASVTGFFRGESGAKKYNLHVGHALIRKFMSRLSQRQNHYISLPTNKAYEDFTKRKKLEPETVNLKHDGLGHWLGDKNAKNVLVYFHGGGFTLPANPVYFSFFWKLIKALNAKGHDISIFFLTYTLTPHGSYPTQMRQSVEAVRYILTESGRSPSNVFLGGDSAGGNLTLAVLSHISHPHAEIDPLEISEPLAGAFCVGPWVSFRSDWPSERRNRRKDLIVKEVGEIWSQAYLNGRQADNWNEPLLAPAEWWKEVKVREVLVLAGGDEILLSSIEEFVTKFKSVVPDTIFLVAPDEGHIAPIFDRVVLDNTVTEQEKQLERWLTARL